MYSAVPLSAPEYTSNVSEQYAQISDIETPSHEKDDAPDAKPDLSMLAVWWMEICSSLIGLLCILSIVVVLAVHQGRPLPGWPSLIFIKSLIAIFTALFKASLIFPVAEDLGQLKWNWFNCPQKLNDLVLFDNASRGTWGCEIVANYGRATVSRANNYSANENPRFDTYGRPIPITNAEMLAAINRGLVDPPKAAEFIGFDCTSGNCTFEQDGGGAYFSSLAMCHSCKDISQEVVKIVRMGPRTYNTNYYIPWNEDIEVEAGVPMTFLTVAETPAEIHRNDSSPPVHSFDLLALNKPLVLKGSMKTTKYRLLAAQCRFDPCVKNYSARVSKGVYMEEEHGDALLLKRRPSFSLKFEGVGKETSFGLVRDSVLVDGEERKCKPTADGESDRTSRSVAYPTT
ncbi:hypothetical protein CSOJ01_05600 [Colletotrichum sojae]|uniref:Uncharacterized protein n=1 Tax=Colletotrichum sojae TaxID=2175907 RepID=A0A8H6JFB2_9PEZI|nr:hypothetical protein CSOJ01_05600 [Colletotrichum sojae]